MGTFFFRNRPELDLLVRLLREKPCGSELAVAVLGCSKGAEVFSISFAIRCARPDLKLTLHAVDMEGRVLDFARAGVYSLNREEVSATASVDSVNLDAIAYLTLRDQPSSMFERMYRWEMEELFDTGQREVTVKPLFRQGITWTLADVRDPQIVGALGLQDIVVANRFLCHMQPDDAEACLRNIARLVKPGGYLFVSGVDLAVRSEVARDLGWKPVPELIREIHRGDWSLRDGWPLEYWGLEPFCENRSDWMIRYASVFQICGALSRRDSAVEPFSQLVTGEAYRSLSTNSGVQRRFENEP